MSYIVNLYGVTRHPVSNEFALVMTYYKDGDLRTFLSTEFDLITWKMRTHMLYDICQAIYHAHRDGIIHCDIHSGNILNGNSLGEYAYLTDFGLSKVVSNSAKHTNGNGSYGVVPYMAPELLRGSPYSMASDVYALGMLMWELSAGEPPFNDREHDTDLIPGICNGERPNIVDGTPDCWIQLMTKCWDSDPTKRPNAYHVKNEVWSWDYNNQKQLEMAEQYREQNPRPPRKSRHPGAVYNSRFIPCITRETLLDDDEWDKIVRLFSLFNCVYCITCVLFRAWEFVYDYVPFFL
jgi:serine/threonine protein kinase